MNTAAVESFDAGVAALGIIDGGRADASQALRFFVAATEHDPQMCDAWLGRILCGDNESGIVYQAWKCRDQMHAQLARLNVPRGAFVPRIDVGMGILALEYPILDRGVLSIALARMQAMGNPPDYEDALDTLGQAPDLPLARWVTAAMYYRAERWPEVISTLASEERQFESDLVLHAAVRVALGVAHAFLGEFDAAERYLRLADAQDSLPGAKSMAQWFLALIARERGEEEAALALMRQVNTIAPSQEVAAAIDDPGVRLKVTSREAVAARTDPWDPASGPDAQELAGRRAAERRAELLAQATEELDAQIGMHALKDQIKTFRARIRMAEKRRELGLKTPGSTNHMVFVGPPGTGKTTVARIIAKTLCGLGIVSTSNVKEVSAKNLIGQYLGHSENLTNEAVDQALDGVLFIDEAYALVGSKTTSESSAGAFGEAVVDTLLTRLENDRERLVVIIAGYEADIDRLLDTNEGLRGRFAHRFKFDTYSPEELVAIAKALSAGRDDVLADGATEVLLATCKQLAGARVYERSAVDAVGNGRFVRKAIEAAADMRDLRLDEDPPLDFDDQTLMAIEDVDMVAALRKVLAESSDAATDLTVLVGDR